MTTVTRNPTAYTATKDWLAPFNAYTSNNAYAVCAAVERLAEYRSYGFDGVLPPVISIEKVLVGLEFYVTQSLEGIKISVYNGVEWSDWSQTFGTMEEMRMWINVTDAFSWTRDMLCNIKARVKLVAEGGSACPGFEPEKTFKSVYLDWIPTRVTYSLAVGKVQYSDGLVSVST